MYIVELLKDFNFLLFWRKPFPICSKGNEVNQFNLLFSHSISRQESNIYIYIFLGGKKREHVNKECHLQSFLDFRYFCVILFRFKEYF